MLKPKEKENRKGCRSDEPDNSHFIQFRLRYIPEAISQQYCPNFRIIHSQLVHGKHSKMSSCRCFSILKVMHSNAQNIINPVHSKAFGSTL